MSFRAETFGTDLRDRPAQVQQAVNLYQTVASKKRGQLIFLSGAPGSGRSDTLQAIAESLRQAKPRPKVIAGKFKNGIYTPWSFNPVSKLPLKKIAAAIGSSVSLIPGVAQFIGQLIQAGAATWEVADEIIKQAEHSPEMLKRLLRFTAKVQPVVYLLDDLDAAEGSGWANLLLEFAAEMNADLPLLFFLALEGQAELGEHEEDESNLLYIARHLKKRGLADWWHLPPLNREDIAAWIGSAAPGLAQYLHDATGGYPGWVIQLWHDCQERGVVTYSDEAARWQWAANRAPSLNLVKHLLDDRLKKLLGDDDPRKLEQTRTLLACAALEGRRFTAEAVAQVTGRERDDLIDFFDDHLVASTERADGILHEDDSVTIDDEQTGTRTFWRYSFVSDLHWHAMQSRYSLTAAEQKQLSLTLAHTLTALYAPDERLIARTLARLFKAGGDETAARNHQRTADYATSRAALRQQALLLMAINKDDWDKDRCRQATQLLMAAGRQMLLAYPFEETLGVFEAAYQMACQSRSIAEQADALFYFGFVLSESGNYSAARENFHRSLAIFWQTGNRTGEAATLHNLALIESRESNYQAARELYQLALTISQQISDHAGEANTLNELALIELEVSNYSAARELFQRTLTTRQQIGDRAGEAATLHNLASIDFNEGNYPAARKLFQKALTTFQQIGHRVWEAATLHNLASIDFNEGNYPAARELFQQALTTRQQIGDRAGEAATLNSLATIDRYEDNYPAARELLQLALAIHQQIGDHAGEASTLHQFASLDLKQGNYSAARELFQRALTTRQQIGDRAGEAATLHQLATIDLNEGNYPAARDLFQRALTTFQQIGDHASEATTFIQLGVGAYRQGKLPQAVRLIALSFGLLQTIGHKDARVAAGWLTTMAEELNYTQDQVEALLAEVAQEYTRDRGAGLVRAAFGEE